MSRGGSHGETVVEHGGRQEGEHFSVERMTGSSIQNIDIYDLVVIDSRPETPPGSFAPGGGYLVGGGQDEAGHAHDERHSALQRYRRLLFSL